MLHNTNLDQGCPLRPTSSDESLSTLTTCTSKEKSSSSDEGNSNIHPDGVLDTDGEGTSTGAKPSSDTTIESKLLEKPFSRASLLASFGSLASLDDMSISQSSDDGLDDSSMIFQIQSLSYESKEAYGSNQHDIKSRDSSGSGNPWGWFNMESVDEKVKENRDVREQWLKNVKDINNLDGKDCDSNMIVVLFQWRNPNHSVSMRCSGSKNELVWNSSSFDMRLSSAIAGYRIVQLSSGEICAEFNFLFCYGSRSFSCWKRFGEFKKLHSIVQYAHKTEGNHFEMFPKSLENWRNLRAKQKFTKCLSVVYLIEKSIMLGRYVQSLLMESDSPGLLVYFSQCDNICV